MTDAWHAGEAQKWRSGRWSLEVRGDEFADLAYDGRVVLRSVRGVVRDRNWDTAALVVDRVDMSDLALTLHVHSAGLGSDLRGIVRAETRGARLRVLADLESQTPFAANRTGLVVLHPPGLAGSPLRVTHPDAAVEASAFPSRISPHQPAFDIAGLAWSQDGLDVTVRFDGDVFEMEDQRNWTDASYKTYSRPLALPFPYPLAAGERVVQSIDLEVTGAPVTAEADAVTRIRLAEGPALPQIAVSAATAPDPAPDGAATAPDPAPDGAATAPDPAPDAPATAATVLVELDLATRNWRAALTRAAASGRPLDVRFVLADDDPALVHEGALALRGLPVVRATAFWPTGPARHVSDIEAIALLREALVDAGVETHVVGGARSHFTELNRERHRLPRGLDGIVFSSTPLFHSLSTAQLVEALPIQRLVAAQAVEIAGGLPVHIGPISLRPHFNDVATTTPPMPVHADLRDGYGSALTPAADPRQTSPELAAWTVASAAALAVPGVATLAYFEEWGPRGLRTADGTPLPVLDAVSALATMAGEPGVRGDSPDGLVWAIGARTAGDVTVLVANLDRVPRAVEVALPDGATRSVEVAPGAFVRT